MSRNFFTKIEAKDQAQIERLILAMKHRNKTESKYVDLSRTAAKALDGLQCRHPDFTQEQLLELHDRTVARMSRPYAGAVPDAPKLIRKRSSNRMKSRRKGS